MFFFSVDWLTIVINFFITKELDTCHHKAQKNTFSVKYFFKRMHECLHSFLLVTSYHTITNNDNNFVWKGRSRTWWLLITRRHYNNMQCKTTQHHITLISLCSPTRRKREVNTELIKYQSFFCNLSRCNFTNECTLYSKSEQYIFSWPDPHRHVKKGMEL